VSLICKHVCVGGGHVCKLKPSLYKPQSKRLNVNQLYVWEDHHKVNQFTTTFM